jgi:glycosyltransferase involved in cell wall biosynthesis
MNFPKISIVTVSYNSRNTISETIESVLSQTYPHIEYIIVDGNSTDGTIEIIKSYGNRITKFISESDNGIYHAMNKGIKLSTGDIVGILNSDDVLSDTNILEIIAQSFINNDIDSIYGDVRFIDPKHKNKIVRYYSSKRFHVGRFKFGFMPAHPSFYAKKVLFDQYGYYKEDYVIASDFELLIRFLYTHKITSKYIELPFVTMRLGGISTKSLKSNFILNNEILRACRDNGIKTNLLNVYLKYFIKIFEFLGNNKFNE